MSVCSVAIIVAAIIIAGVNPLPAIPAPAPIPVRRGVVSERYAKEREVIESIDEKTSVAETILKAVLNVVRADTLGQRLGYNIQAVAIFAGQRRQWGPLNTLRAKWRNDLWL